MCTDVKNRYSGPKYESRAVRLVREPQGCDERSLVRVGRTIDARDFIEASWGARAETARIGSGRSRRQTPIRRRTRRSSDVVGQ